MVPSALYFVTKGAALTCPVNISPTSGLGSGNMTTKLHEPPKDHLVGVVQLIEQTHYLIVKTEIRAI